MKFKSSGTGSGNKNFVRLKSGESIQGIFRGEPYDFKQHWINNAAILCPEQDCDHCKQGLKPAFRFRINFVVNENGAYTPKIFEQGWTVYESLRTLHESDYNLEKTVVKITRHGSGTDTTYSVIPRPDGQLKKEVEQKIAAIKLLELSHWASDESQAQEPEIDDDLPF